MDIARRIRHAHHLTPTEQYLASTILALGDRVQSFTIKELASACTASVSSIHRLCRKLGLSGFKELKVELARSGTTASISDDIDVNFPFQPGDQANDIAPRMELLYEATLRDTREVLSTDEVNHVATLIDAASCVDIYTTSHNLYPANMFCDRLLSVGKNTTCHENGERQIRSALATSPEHLAIIISYSGFATFIPTLLPILLERGCPVIFIGTPRAARMHRGLTAYLLLSDSESLQHRITQFASHISVQYVLDTLFSCYTARTFNQSVDFLISSLPYTRLPGSADTSSNEGAQINQTDPEALFNILQAAR